MTDMTKAEFSVELPAPARPPQDFLTAARKVAENGITNEAQAQGVVKLISLVKELADSIEASFEPAVKAAHETHKKILAARNAHTDVLEESEKLLRTQLNKYVKESGATLAGVTARNSWTYDVVNIDLVPRDFMVLDEKKVKAYVKAMKEKANIPGIRAFEDKTVAIAKKVEDALVIA